MKLNQIKDLIQNKPSSLKDGYILTETGKFIGYQEMEMDSSFLDVQEDISYAKDTVSLHSHSFYEILFIRSGNLQYLIGNTRYQLQKNDIVLLPPGISHQPLFLEKLTEPYQRTVLWVNGNHYQKCKSALCHTEQITDDSLEYPQYVIRAEGTLFHQMKQIFEALLYEKNHNRPGSELYCIGLYTQLFCLFYRVSFTQNLSACPKPEKPGLLDEILQYIEEHLSEEISLRSISSQFLVSQSSVSQIFKKQMNVSFYKVVTQRRLIEAKNLIIAGTPLKEVTELCGFSDYSVFYKAFVKQYGISPKEFRLRERE